MAQIARFPGREKKAESCHVVGCHGFLRPQEKAAPSSLRKNDEKAPFFVAKPLRSQLGRFLGHPQEKEKTYKRKQTWGIVLRLDGWQSFVCVFWGVIPSGEKKHVNKSPPKILGQSREFFVFVYFFFVFFWSQLSKSRLSLFDRVIPESL